MPREDAPDLLHLLHEVGLGVEPAGRVDDDDVDAPAACGLQRVEGDGSRVGALPVGYDVGADTAAPHLQLLDGSRPEGVGRAEEHLLAVVDVEPGQLGDVRRLACAVHADHEYRVRDLAVLGDGAGRNVQDSHQLLLEYVDCAIGVRYALVPDAPLESFEELLGGAEADVGGDQQLLELLPELVVQAPGAKEVGDVGEPGAPGLFGGPLGLLALSASQELEHGGPITVGR